MKIILTSADDLSRFMVDTRNIIGASETGEGTTIVSILNRGIGFNSGNDKVMTFEVLNSVDFLTASINRDSNLFSYTVRFNDTLSEIAMNLGVSVEYLQILNNITNPNKIYVGNTIYY
ncbi:hypothetical protein KNT81_gp266 [Proteus phage phiP4-3]|uniref:LysM domain-containing protein n=1 Tax=Proteus phage phiP4-3 TaxID=2065203 RepID=A0A2I6PFJ7_9CAUD|nr:hypothetical protein KNT81_gp266 [Proteus phage phiP4-3]AUM58505.1 hypothetical protein phiP43_147 [Proteus phage phiP4-3]